MGNDSGQRSVATPVATANERPHRSEDATDAGTRRDEAAASAYKTWGKSRSVRLKDFDYASPWVVYHLTLCAAERQNTFTSRSVNLLVIDALQNAAGLYGYDLIAYCLMPDHLHILAQAREQPKDLRLFVRGLKSYCTTAARSVATPVATNSRLWQRGFHEHILRKEENINDVAAYILDNPVRAGLASDCRQYEWADVVPRRDGSLDATDCVR
jgi:REP element-mobilizing transposase RayT